MKYVIDGDTIILKNGEKMRYIGIDAPEIEHENSPAERLAHAAKAFNQEISGTGRVRFEYDREARDHYGRRLAYVFRQDDLFVNRELLRSGLAYFLYKPPNLKYADILLQAQRLAMSERKGLWRAWHEERQSYIGNRKSKRLHFPGCRYGKKTAKENKVVFTSQWDAYWEGYSPCSKCLK